MNYVQYEGKPMSNYKYQGLVISGHKYLVAVHKMYNTRKVIVTDLVQYYEENLSKETVSKRCMELNPLLIDCNFEDIIDNLLLNIAKYTVSSTLNCIQLENKIDDGRFLFNINLTKSSGDSYQNEFMNKLFFCFFEIQRRYNYLLNIVKRKDEELTEFKSQDHAIPIKNLLSEPFNEKVFTKSMHNIKSVDKIDIFLHAMDFYNTIENEQNSEITAQELIISRTASGSDKIYSQAKSTTVGKSIKRLSSNIRCAVSPKIERKRTIPKKPKDYIIERL